MKQKDLQFFHSLTDLNVRFLFKDTNRNLYETAGPLAVETLKQLNTSFVNDPEIEQTETVSIRDTNGLRYLAASADDGYLLVGPFILDEDPPPVLGRGNPLGLSMPIRTIDKIKAYNQLIKLRIRTEFEFEDEALNTIETHNPAFENSIKIDTDEIENRYKAERYIRHLIASGKKDEIRDVFKQESRKVDFHSRMPNNPLRVLKNLSIILNSIGRLSAEKGGLPPFLLHSISEGFAIKIEEQTSAEGIDHLQREILLTYCDAVYNYGIENHSGYIVKTCQYILLNLHTKIDLKTLAENASVNPSYLSRRFKEETGQTIWSYIREKRMMEAMWMLSRTEESITDVALSLGYEDVNYFSKVFHRERGMSPRDYRQKHWREDFDGIPG